VDLPDGSWYLRLDLMTMFSRIAQAHNLTLHGSLVDLTASAVFANDQIVDGSHSVLPHVEVFKLGLEGKIRLQPFSFWLFKPFNQLYTFNIQYIYMVIFLKKLSEGRHRWSW